MDVQDVVKGIIKRKEESHDEAKNIILDIGNLTAWDPDPIRLPKDGPEREEYFKNLARSNCQTILDKIFTKDEVLTLPDPTTILPRAKPIPVRKPPTKWETFARSKGIKSNTGKTREKLVWDEVTKQWVPRYGYKKVQNDKQKNWISNDNS